MSFANLKKNSSNSVSNLNKLSKKLESESKGGYDKDERYWLFDVDKAGNGFAVIRFLPAPEGEEFPYVKMFEYAFKHKKTNRWYIENSRDTIGEPDPVNEEWARLWNAGQKDEAKQYSRGTKYISNIEVIEDEKHPENNGKRFLWKYGPRLFQKIEGVVNPEFKDEIAFDPFDLWKGANFKLKARQLDGQRSYDKSEFDKPTPHLGGDDKKLEALYNSLYPLLPEIAPDKFKPYDVLKTRFLSVIGGAPVQDRQAPSNSEKSSSSAQDDDAPFEPDAPKSSTPKGSAKPAASDEDDLEAYRKMLED
jgi:hypothetical protein